tara:strand:- start:1133 stop:1510 length:378 start_codon:yes stop_codon:yes gene_type:complete
MREIKFRGLLQAGFFIYGSYATDGKDYHSILRQDPLNAEGMLNTPIIADTLGQFTGLQDKDGVDIYEGDIVKIRSASHKIIWESYFAQFNLQNVKSGIISEIYRDVLSEESILIGNIHQNPELIK